MWEYYNDSTVSIDSVQFKLYLIDSSKSSNVEQLQLFSVQTPTLMKIRVPI